MISTVAQQVINYTSLLVDQEGFVPLGTNGKYTLIDGFCGMGGVTDGFAENEQIEPIIGINHSEKAIACFKKNFPGVKVFQEDWTTLDEKLLPRKVNFFWMSAECTHHSIAAGGNSRDPKSRSLADHLERYVIWCNPDYILVENVREFLSWGPVEEKKDKNGNTLMKFNKELKCMMPVLKPIKHLKKTFYNRWVKTIKNLGYEYEYRLINSADFGAPTSRLRYFGCFAKKGLKIVFPEPTHSKHPKRTGLLPWVPCRTVIDLEVEGNSIFGRKYNMDLPKRLRKKLCDNTLKRHAYGIRKFFLNDFISKQYSSNGKGVDVSSLNEPLHTIPCRDTHAYIKLIIEERKRSFITQNIQNSINANSIEEPLRTILTRDEKVLCQIHFIDKDNTNKYNVQSVNEPLGGILCSDSKKLISVKTQFIDKYNTQPHNIQSVEEPLHTIMTADSKNLITISTQEEVNSIIELEKREFIEKYFSEDGIEVVEFLCWAIKDIKMRYLSSTELARASGFKDGMAMGDSEQERKLHIGNAVPPAIPYAWSRALIAA